MPILNRAGALLSLASLTMLVASTALASKPTRRTDPFEDAITSGDLARTRQLLETNHSPDALTFLRDGSPLAFAIETGRYELMDLLLSHKANVELRPASLPPGWTLRCWARLAGAKFEARMADAGGKTNPTCEAEVAYLLAVRSGDVRTAKRGPGPMGMSLALAKLALERAIATRKAPLLNAVIQASGNPDLARAVGVATYPEDP